MRFWAFASGSFAYARRRSSSTPEYVATVERTFAPMGVASIRFARCRPSASIARTCFGSGSSANRALSAGTRLSSTSVVFPDPETPVMAVSRPRGISTDNGLTVWMASVSRRSAPFAKMLSTSALSRTRTVRSPERKGPMRDASVFSTSSILPCAMTLPPSAPDSGPISTRWSTWRSTRTSWSTTRTELPSAIRSSITPSSPSTFEGCRPMDGSSST